MFHPILALVWLIANLLLSNAAYGQTPSGFHWVDFKREGATVSKVERALKDEDYSAIREIGLTDAFALVLTVRREPGLATFDGDQWRVYNIPTKTWVPQSLLIGYNLQVKDWIEFQERTSQDLGVVYMDCWECEPATVFTALHYDPHSGWRARWASEKDPTQPGITMLVTDVGDPYTNEDVDQIFSVPALGKDVATVGTWYRSKDLATGKISETVTKFWIDQSSGKEKSADLTGAQATAWKLVLCKARNSPYGLSQGQSSGSCKSVMRAKVTPSR